jgi:O-antigen/teichoic acid export membrane protein
MSPMTTLPTKRQTYLQMSIKTQAYSTIVAFSGRIGLYLAGFVFNFMIANALSPIEFGMFSTTMAASEFMTIFLTLGSGLLIFRSTYELKSVPIKTISRILLVGLTMIATSYIAVVKYFPEWSSYAQYAIITAFGLSLSSLLLQSLRALDWTILFIYEHFVRQMLYIVAILAVLLGSATGTIELKTAFLCMIFGTTSYAALVLALSIARNNLNYRTSETRPLDYLSMLFAAICSYVSRKGDILLLSLLVSSSAIASIKIALLISEIPFQFVQNLFIQNANVFISARSDQQARRTSMIQLTVWSAIISVVALLALPLFSKYVWPKLDFVTFVPQLLVYYFMRTLLLPIEQRLVMGNHPKLLVILSFIGALFKISLLAIAVSSFDLFGLNAYPVIGLAELFVVEIIFRMSLGESYLKWCFGKVQI